MPRLRPQTCRVIAISVCFKSITWVGGLRRGDWKDSQGQKMEVPVPVQRSFALALKVMAPDRRSFQPELSYFFNVGHNKEDSNLSS